jgi:hypothetical protein
MTSKFIQTRLPPENKTPIAKPNAKFLKPKKKKAIKAYANTLKKDK